MSTPLEIFKQKSSIFQKMKKANLKCLKLKAFLTCFRKFLSKSRIPISRRSKYKLKTRRTSLFTRSKYYGSENLLRCSYLSIQQKLPKEKLLKQKRWEELKRCSLHPFLMNSGIPWTASKQTQIYSWKMDRFRKNTEYSLISSIRAQTCCFPWLKTYLI